MASKTAQPGTNFTARASVRKDTDTIYVYLCSGEVCRVSPATSVLVQTDCVSVYNEGSLVWTYPRRQVYSCSKSDTPPVIT